MVLIPQICHGDSLYVETERLVDNVRRLYPSHSRSSTESRGLRSPTYSPSRSLLPLQAAHLVLHRGKEKLCPPPAGRSSRLSRRYSVPCTKTPSPMSGWRGCVLATRRRWATYQFPEHAPQPSLFDRPEGPRDSSHKGGDSSHKPADSSRKKEDSSRKETSLHIEMPESVLVVANSERASAAPHQKGHVPDESMLRKRGLIQGRKPRLIIILNKISDNVILNAFPGGSGSYK